MRSFELANVAAEYNGCFQFNGFQMVLQPESGVPEMLTKIQTLQIGNEFRVRPGAKAAGMQSIKYMEEAQKRGQEHLRRGHSLPAYSPLQLRRLLPVQRPADLGSDQELIRSKAKLRDKDIRRKIEQERIACQGKLEFPEWHGWDRVVFEHLEKPELKKFEQKNVEEISRITEKAPVDAFFDTWIEDDLQLGRFCYHGLANAHPELLAEMIKSDTSLIGTDVGAHLDRFFWHGAPDQNLGYWTPRETSFQSRTGGA